MDNVDRYLEHNVDALQRIRKEEGPSIERAAEEISDRTAEGRLLHVIGTGGHSYMAGEEVFYRAGGFVPINSILDVGVSLSSGAVRTTKVERVSGYAQGLLEYYGVQEGDAIIINNAAGVNAMTIEAAQESKRLGLCVIALTSKEFADSVPAGHVARHKSNKNLHEIADITVDMKAPSGDAVIDIEGVEQKVGPVSTIATCFILHSIIIKTVEKLAKRGLKVPVWRSANVPGGDEANRQHLQEYRGKIRHL